MRVLVTGADGFIGRNLIVQLQEKTEVEILRFCRNDGDGKLSTVVSQADFIFHLAGTNRPTNPDEFKLINTDLTANICFYAAHNKKKPPIVFASSTQAASGSLYGISKQRAEEILTDFSRKYGTVVSIFRLPNIFGKWCRPNYNSVVATFCHNIAYGLPITVHDSNTQINLVYIDDVIKAFIGCLDSSKNMGKFLQAEPIYHTTVGEIAKLISSFRNLRNSFSIERVGIGLVRALYSTYLSYLPPTEFSYMLPIHKDERGRFVEMLKTPDCGQFSYFTAKPGVTRGGHYHHSKTEKFLVIQGEANFGFKHIITGERFEITTTGSHPQVVETVPGWSHNITNIGSSELITLLWANEVFDVQKPDTTPYEVR